MVAKNFIIAVILGITLIGGGMGGVMAGGLDSSFGYTTQDIDKGVKVAEEVLTLDVQTDFGAIDIGAKATVDYATEDFTGVDLTLGSINELGAVTVGATYTYEYYEDAKDAQRANATFGFNMPLNPVLGVEVDLADMQDGVYATISGSDTVQITEKLDVNLSAEIAYNTMNALSVDDEVYLASGTAGTAFNLINDNVSIEPFITYTQCISDSCEANFGDANDFTYGVYANVRF